MGSKVRDTMKSGRIGVQLCLRQSRKSIASLITQFDGILARDIECNLRGKLSFNKIRMGYQLVGE